MEELEYMLKSVAGCQTDTRQVILTADQFSMMQRMIRSIFDLIRDQGDSIHELTQKLKFKTQEADDLKEDLLLMSESMQEWELGVHRQLESVRQDIRLNSEANSRWAQEAKIELRRNEFLEATISDYSSKLASTRADLNILTRQAEKLSNEKELLQENLRRQENSLQAQTNLCRSFRDKFEKEVLGRKADNISWEMKCKNLETLRQEEAKKQSQDINDLSESLKRIKDRELVLEGQLQKMDKEFSRISDLLTDKAKASEKLEVELQKAKKELEKIKPELSTAKKTIKDLEKQLDSKLDSINQLEASLAEVMKELEEARQQAEDLAKGTTKITKGKKEAEYQRNSEEVEELKRDLKFAKEILTKGTFSNFKHKSDFLAKLFQIDKAQVTKTKQSYIQLIQPATEYRDERPKSSLRSSKSPHRMDEEQRVSRDSKKSRKSGQLDCSPEKAKHHTRTDNHFQADEDTALKKALCNHRKLEPGCESCELSGAQGRKPLLGNRGKQHN